MRSRDNEDKHHERRAGGGKQEYNRQKLDSSTKEPELVEQCQGILKHVSSALPCSHYQRRQSDKHNSQKRIKQSLYQQELESSFSPASFTKQAKHEDVGKDIHQHKKEAKVSNNRWGISRSEVADHESEQLNTGDTGSQLSVECKLVKYSNRVSQRTDISNKRADITPPSLTISTPISVRTDMNLFNFRKYVEDLVEDQCWLVDKIVRLKEELNIIILKMEAGKGQGCVRGSTSVVEIMKHAQCRQCDRESLCSSNNCLQLVRHDVCCDNMNRDLSSPTLNNSETSSSFVESSHVSRGNNYNDWSRNATVLNRQGRTQQEISDTVSLSCDSSSASEPAFDLCSSTEQSISCVLRLVQYLFLLVLVVAQFIVQFVTMGT